MNRNIFYLHPTQDHFDCHVRKRRFGFLSGKDEFAAGSVPQLLKDRDSAIGQRHTVFTTGLHPSRNKPASMFSMPRPIRQMAGCNGEGPGACEGVGENGYVLKSCPEKCCLSNSRDNARSTSRTILKYRVQSPNKTPAWMLSRALEIVDNAVRSPERQRR
jgi:hypothetical protein